MSKFNPNAEPFVPHTGETPDGQQNNSQQQNGSSDAPHQHERQLQQQKQSQYPEKQNHQLEYQIPKQHQSDHHHKYQYRSSQNFDNGHAGRRGSWEPRSRAIDSYTQSNQPLGKDIFKNMETWGRHAGVQQENCFYPVHYNPYQVPPRQYPAPSQFDHPIQSPHMNQPLQYQGMQLVAVPSPTPHMQQICQSLPNNGIVVHQFWVSSMPPPPMHYGPPPQNAIFPPPDQCIERSQTVNHIGTQPVQNGVMAFQPMPLNIETTASYTQNATIPPGFVQTQNANQKSNVWNSKSPPKDLSPKNGHACATTPSSTPLENVGTALLSTPPLPLMSVILNKDHLGTAPMSPTLSNASTSQYKVPPPPMLNRFQNQVAMPSKKIPQKMFARNQTDRRPSVKLVHELSGVPFSSSAPPFTIAAAIPTTGSTNQLKTVQADSGFDQEAPNIQKDANQMAVPTSIHTSFISFELTPMEDKNAKIDKWLVQKNNDTGTVIYGNPMLEVIRAMEEACQEIIRESASATSEVQMENKKLTEENSKLTKYVEHLKAEKQAPIMRHPSRVWQSPEEYCRNCGNEKSPPPRKEPIIPVKSETEKLVHGIIWQNHVEKLRAKKGAENVAGPSASQNSASEPVDNASYIPLQDNRPTTSAASVQKYSNEVTVDIKLVESPILTKSLPSNASSLAPDSQAVPANSPVNKYPGASEEPVMVYTVQTRKEANAIKKAETRQKKIEKNATKKILQKEREEARKKQQEEAEKKKVEEKAAQRELQLKKENEEREAQALAAQKKADEKMKKQAEINSKKKQLKAKKLALSEKKRNEEEEFITLINAETKKNFGFADLDKQSNKTEVACCRISDISITEPGCSAPVNHEEECFSSRRESIEELPHSIMFPNDGDQFYEEEMQTERYGNDMSTQTGGNERLSEGVTPPVFHSLLMPTDSKESLHLN